MIKANNTVILSGGLTRDPEEQSNGSLIVMSLAVDGAGSEKDVKGASGYFDVKFWLTDSDYNAQAAVKDVREGLKNGVLKKGTRVQVVGSLRQERWTKDGQKFNRVVVMAESVSFYSGGASNSNGASNNNQMATAAAAPTATFNASEF